MPVRVAAGQPILAQERIEDTVFTEAAQALGRLLAANQGTDDDRIRTLFLRCLSRPPNADETAALFDEMGSFLDARADEVVRTTQPRHYAASQEIWKRMEANGDIYLSKYEGWYSVRDEAYYDEGELTTNADGKKFAPKTLSLLPAMIESITRQMKHIRSLPLWPIRSVR